MTTPSAATEWGSAGSWFGTTLGSTCWLAISSVLLLVHGEFTVALTVTACFLLPLGVSLRAWARRDRATVYGALEA